MNTDVHRPRKEKDAVFPGVTMYRQGRDGSWEGAFTRLGHELAVSLRAG